VGFLKDINDKYRNASARQKDEEVRTKTKVYTKDRLYLREDKPRYVTHNLKTEIITVEVLDENMQPVDVISETLSDTRIKITSSKAVRNATVSVTGTINKGANPFIFIGETTLRVLMGVRTVNVTYSKSGGTLLPGYLPGTDWFGTQMVNGSLEPGWGFLAGWQDDGYAGNAFGRSGDVLTRDRTLNDPFSMNETERFTFRATVEPFNGLKIDITANHSSARNLSEYYVADSSGKLPNQELRGRVESGNFSMSYISLGTAFEKIGDDVESSSTFQQLKGDYRKDISERLAIDYMQRTGLTLKDSAGYYEGFGPTSQEVLIPAFLAAYGKKDIGTISTKAFRGIAQVMPNWSVRFDGIGKIPAVKEYVNSVVINHAYRSTYNVGSFISNPFYTFDTLQGVPIAIDLQGNFMVENNINTISINENFSPLFDLNMDWKNSLTTRIEYRRSRTVAMNMANTQVNEVNSGEIIVGMGYRFNEVPLQINQRSFDSDLNVRADFSMRNNRTVIRKLEDLSGSEITAGQRIFSLKVSADYMLSDKFTVRAFYDQRLTTPYISNSYPNANYNMGFSLTFML